MKEVYILLTRTRTIASQLIKIFEPMEYTHSAISIDLYNNEFYTFSRKYMYLLLPGGMIIEGLGRGNFKRFRKCKCRLYSIKVTNEQYNRINQKIADMYMKNYKYNIIGLLLCKFGISKIRDNYRFCSEFVAEVLMDAKVVDLKKNRSLCTPMDLTKIPNSELVFEGRLDELYRKIQSDIKIHKN